MVPLSYIYIKILILVSASIPRLANVLPVRGMAIHQTLILSRKQTHKPRHILIGHLASPVMLHGTSADCVYMESILPPLGDEGYSPTHHVGGNTSSRVILNAVQQFGNHPIVDSTSIVSTGGIIRYRHTILYRKFTSFYSQLHFTSV